MPIPGDQVVANLEAVGCRVEGSPDGVLTVTPPSWRPDLAAARRPRRGGHPAGRLRPDPRRAAAGTARSGPVARAARAAPGRPGARLRRLRRGAHLPVPVARDLGPARRRPGRPASQRPAAREPAVRRGARAAHRAAAGTAARPAPQRAARHARRRPVRARLRLSPAAGRWSGAPAGRHGPADRRGAGRSRCSAAGPAVARRRCRRRTVGGGRVVGARPTGHLVRRGRGGPHRGARCGCGARRTPWCTRAVAPRSLRRADGRGRGGRPCRRAAAQGSRRTRPAGADRRDGAGPVRPPRLTAPAS